MFVQSSMDSCFAVFFSRKPSLSHAISFLPFVLLFLLMLWGSSLRSSAIRKKMSLIPRRLATSNLRTVTYLRHQVRLARTLGTMATDFCCIQLTGSQYSGSVIGFALLSNLSVNSYLDASLALGLAVVSGVLSAGVETVLLDWISVDKPAVCSVNQRSLQSKQTLVW